MVWIQLGMKRRRFDGIGEKKISSDGDLEANRQLHDSSFSRINWKRLKQLESQDGKTDYRRRIRIINQDMNKYNKSSTNLFVVRFTNKDKNKYNTLGCW
ncbi:PREDICTED: 60S ribosomal protein L5-2-like [Camelina sativa]|uniref:60S ribosomal protein L5-2-like n=1 Tax=Camelina sativa TaxID=90675 RepID=A0ABM0U3Z8_CAMSA|nr:PREDICTED: 60S ribosomal protein L5-2-like [Camelina sativa]